MNYNIATNQPYQGNNQMELQIIKNNKRYVSNAWGTFLQFKELGRKVKKGEHGYRLMKLVLSGSEEDKKTYPKRFVVFNLDQTEGVEVQTQYIKSEEKIIPKLPVML